MKIYLIIVFNIISKFIKLRFSINANSTKAVGIVTIAPKRIFLKSAILVQEDDLFLKSKKAKLFQE